MIKCGNVLSTTANFKENIKEDSDNSASTISDCYSDEDEYKEGILQDCHLNQSTILFSHESAAFDDDQIEEKPIINRDKHFFRANKSSIVNNNYNYVSQAHDERLSLSNSKVVSQIQDLRMRSPEFFSEFYRPPSRSKNSFTRRKHISENASISSNHYIESSIETSTNYRKSKVFQIDSLSDSDNLGNSKNSSTSLFNCSSQFQTSNRISNDDSTIKMISSTSLNSKTQSESINKFHNTRKSNENLFLDYEYNPACRSQMETFTHSVLYRKPKLKTTIKSTTSESINTFREQMTQTSYKPKLKEKCVGTIKLNNAHQKSRYESGDNGDSLINFGFTQIEGLKETDPSRHLMELLQLLQKHVNTATANLKGCAINQSLVSTDVNDDDKEKEPIKFLHSYPDMLVIELYKQIKHMYNQLDTQLRYDSVGKEPIRHQRHYSDILRNKDPVFNNGDFNVKQEFDNDLYNKTTNPVVKPVQTPLQNDPDFNGNDDQRDWVSRLFELNPYDDLIKSFQSNTDRRIKAVGNKMKCKIIIEGPFRLYDSTNACWNMRNKIAYHCYLHGHTKEAVDKCLKCLQDTFPQSCLNEKHVINRIESKLIS